MGRTAPSAGGHISAEAKQAALVLRSRATCICMLDSKCSNGVITGTGRSFGYLRTAFGTGGGWRLDARAGRAILRLHAWSEVCEGQPVRQAPAGSTQGQ